MLDQHLYQPHLRGDQRAAYRTHMCGLCHALGDAYGLPFRLATGYDTILLNLLISAQMADAPDIVMRRCPLNPLMQVRTNQNAASDFASAAALALAYAAADDHVVDSNGRDLPALAARIALAGANQRAHATLAAFGFDPDDLSRLTETQQDAEATPSSDSSQPTALITARLFAVSAHIAKQPANADPLSVLGAAYGAYLYLSDAYQDLAKDLRSGDFNPLRGYVNDSALNHAGKHWLIARLERIAATMREQLPRVTLHRDRDLLVRLLTEPCEKLIAALDGRDSARVCASCAKPIHAHAHAAHTTASPIPMVHIQVGEGGGGEPLPPPRRKRTDQETCCDTWCDGCSNTSGTSAGCCDCCHCCRFTDFRCCDCCACCDGNPNTHCCDCGTCGCGDCCNNCDCDCSN